MLETAFIGAWLAPLLLVLQYRLLRLPARLRGIKSALLKEPPDDRPLPAEHYVQLFEIDRREPAVSSMKEAPKDNVHLAGEIELQFTAHHRKWEFCTALSLLAATSGGGLWLIYCWVQRASLPLPYHYGIETVLAVAGAYVWTLYEILNRYASHDLTADDLFSAAIRFLIAIPIGRAVSIFANDSAKASVAFAVTAFPLRDLNRLLRRRALKKIGEEISAERVDRECLLTACVDGIDVATVTRLEELHITTHTNLAYADPIRLMAQTGYSLRMIVQWMDHALLAVYALPYKKKLKEAGLPCSLDVKEFYEAHFALVTNSHSRSAGWTNRCIEKCEAIAALEKKLGLKRELIREIFQRVASDPHVRFLDTLWYTGYMPADKPRLPVCTQHVAEKPPSPSSGPRSSRGARAKPAPEKNAAAPRAPSFAVIVPDPETK